MRKSDWIHIIEPDGSNKIAAPSYITQLLGLEDVKPETRRLFKRIVAIEEQVDELRKPSIKQRILTLLENGERHNKRWFERRISSAGWYLIYQCLSELVEEDVLTITKAGSQDMHSVKEEKIHGKQR